MTCTRACAARVDGYQRERDGSPKTPATATAGPLTDEEDARTRRRGRCTTPRAHSPSASEARIHLRAAVHSKRARRRGEGLPSFVGASWREERRDRRHFVATNLSRLVAHDHDGRTYARPRARAPSRRAFDRRLARVADPKHGRRAGRARARPRRHGAEARTRPRSARARRARAASRSPSSAPEGSAAARAASKRARRSRGESARTNRAEGARARARVIVDAKQKSAAEHDRRHHHERIDGWSAPCAAPAVIMSATRRVEHEVRHT